MATEPEETTQENDAAISWILAGIWLGGLIAVRVLRDDIPLMMLVIGTAFFVVLIPAMKEISRTLNRYFSNRFSNKTN